MDHTTSRPPKKQIPPRGQNDPDASPVELNMQEELRNQQRLADAMGEGDTLISQTAGLEQPPFAGQGNFDNDYEKFSLSSLFGSSSQSEGRQTSDRSPPRPPRESNLDSDRLKKNKSKSPIIVGSSPQSGENHGREQVTDNGRNLGSDQRDPVRQDLSPSQPAARSKARKWEYIQHYMGRKTKFEYEYNQGGRLVADEGYEALKIEFYLSNHDLYQNFENIKDCGLTLWIQRAPRAADYRGGAAEGLCLYENCCVSKDRYINAGDVRVAFDESAAQSPEHDPQTNAGYVHLKCLEIHMKNHRRMFGYLNFKVEGRLPQPNDSLYRNPTTFGTIQEIVYVEDYLEQCRKDGEASQAPGRSPLSSGIEKQTRGQSKRARDIQRKLLELNGFHSLESFLDKKYAEVGGPAETASPIQGRSPVTYPKATDTRRHEMQEQAQRADSSQNDDPLDGGEYQQGENQEYDEHDDMPFDPYHPRIPSPLRRKPPAPRTLPPPTVPESTKEPSRHPQKKQSNKAPPSKAPKLKEKDKEKTITAPYVGRGKWKKRMYLNALDEEVWEEYEDPWSPLESGSDHQPKKRTRVSKKEKEQAKALAAGARSVRQRKNQRQRVNLNDGEGDDDVNEAEGEDEDRRADGDEGEDEDEFEEDHQAKRKRKRYELRG